MNLPIALAYVRGSTEEQVNTLAAQELTAREYCNYRRIVLNQVFSEHETAVGKDFYEREQVQAMLAHAEATGIKHLIFTKLDRCFRSTVDCLLTVADLDKRGYTLHILDLQVDTSTPMGEFFLTINAALGRLEGRIRKQRQEASLRVMHMQGQRAGTVPYGYTTVAANRTSKTGRDAENLAPHPDEYPVLTKMLDWREAGLGWSAIASALNKSGIPSKSGGRWHPSTVQSVITHELNRRKAKGLAPLETMLNPQEPDRQVVRIRSAA